MKLWLVKDGKLAAVDGGVVNELPDGIRAGYTRRIIDSAKRREWKTTGEGAKFAGTFEPGADAESRAGSIRASVTGIAEYGGAVCFSETIDEISGIFKKVSADDNSEAIAVSSNDRIYAGLDIYRHRAATSISRAGESHIAVADLPSFDFSEVTEGHTVESDPVWSRTEPDVLYFSSAGLPEQTGEQPVGPMMTPAAIMNAMERPAASRGPAALCRLDLRSGEFTTLLEDDSFDFLKPFAAEDGSLYYIKRPYSVEKPNGCLFDALMLPVRLVKSLFGFLSFFSLKYSGSPLRSGGVQAKGQDTGKIFIEGNLIDAERELKANRNDKAPGIIPKSWELRKRLPDGSDNLVARGVRCFSVGVKVVYSNGKYLLTPDGEVVAKCDGVSALRFIAD